MWPFAPEPLAGARVAELEAAVDDAETGLAESLAQPSRLDQWTHAGSVAFGRCGRWCSTRRGRPLQATELPTPSPGPASSCSRCCLRRLPHRPAHRRRRADRPEAAARAGPPDRRACAARRRAARARRACRRSLARLDRRRVPVLPQRPREPLRPRASSRATAATAASPSWRWPTSASASRFRRATPTSRPRRSSAPG